MSNRQSKIKLASGSLAAIALLSLTACGNVQTSTSTGATSKQAINYSKSVQTMYKSDGSSTTTTRTYNDKGQNIETESIDDTTGLSSKVRYEYDRSGNIIKSTSISADGTESSVYKSYDNHGNVDRRWSDLEKYDDASDLTKTWREYSYDDSGYITELKECSKNGQRMDNVISDTTYEYDFSLDISDTYLVDRYGFGEDGGPWTTKIVYYPDNDYQSETVRTYDFETDELTEVTTYSNESDSSTKVVTDLKTGHMIQMVYWAGTENEITITYEYDDNNNIIRETYNKSEVYSSDDKVCNHEYKYDDHGRIVEYATDDPDAYIVRYTETYE